MEAVCSIDQPAAESSIYILFTTLSALLFAALMAAAVERLGRRMPTVR